MVLKIIHELAEIFSATVTGKLIADQLAISVKASLLPDLARKFRPASTADYGSGAHSSFGSRPHL